MASDSFQNLKSQFPVIVITGVLSAVGSTILLGVSMSNSIAELAIQQMVTSKQLEAAEDRVSQAYAAQVNFNRSSEAADARLDAEMTALRDRLNRIERSVDRGSMSELSPDGGKMASLACEAPG